MGFLFPALPTVAGYCIRVRVKLGSSGIRRARRLPLVGPLAIERWQELEGPPNRRGEVPTRDFHLCGGLPISFTRTDNHAGVADIVLTFMHRSGAKGFSVDPANRSLQNAGYRLRRIPLPRTRVNKANGGRTGAPKSSIRAAHPPLWLHAAA